MDHWELVAREQIRDTLARYHWAGDAGRIDDLTRTFCPDGTLEVRNVATMSGRREIAAFLGGVTAPARPGSAPDLRRIVRHNLSNTQFLQLTPESALVASYFTVITEIGLDHCGRYRDTLTPHDGEWLIQRRFVSTDWRASDSTMASPSSMH
ncbi:nuclear transport factor 2 family protein [Mycolicibacterium arseniciresistens]|uniref:Nuclear transport factor 2 family protein n=1 Tax=Mycolicibacterium arseniciresistens TaxID=3062257 RepID=A0ABT8URF0_9MYCO|nr:nuclear transport factor 2 family protein [Mycolicibacterium arseniciresistens]MDO3639582.1 nuclear transport factor 2 family protein [Mycolicibacterium arseniciresistens]